jgi:hypothetical protein
LTGLSGTGQRGRRGQSKAATALYFEAELEAKDREIDQLKTEMVDKAEGARTRGCMLKQQNNAILRKGLI